MNMNTSLSISAIPSMLGHALRRFHVMLFTVVILGGLAYVIYSLNTLVTNTTTVHPVEDASSSSSYDKKTIDQLETLRRFNDTNREINTYQGDSPFVE
jgi:hypothetical protein